MSLFNSPYIKPKTFSGNINNNIDINPPIFNDIISTINFKGKKLLIKRMVFKWLNIGIYINNWTWFSISR